MLGPIPLLTTATMEPMTTLGDDVSTELTFMPVTTSSLGLTDNIKENNTGIINSPIYHVEIPNSSPPPSSAAVIGIVVAALVFILSIMLVILCCCCYMKVRGQTIHWVYYNIIALFLPLPLPLLSPLPSPVPLLSFCPPSPSLFPTPPL